MNWTKLLESDAFKVIAPFLGAILGAVLGVIAGYFKRAPYTIRLRQRLRDDLELLAQMQAGSTARRLMADHIDHTMQVIAHRDQKRESRTFQQITMYAVVFSVYFFVLGALGGFGNAGAVENPIDVWKPLLFLAAYGAGVAQHWTRRTIRAWYVHLDRDQPTTPGDRFFARVDRWLANRR